MDGRTESLEGYRFGYQGSEKDNEFKGEGNSYTTEFRQLDPRLGRWLSVDPVIKHHESVYAALANNPLLIIDRLGQDTSFADQKTKEQFDELYLNLESRIAFNNLQIDVFKNEILNTKNEILKEKLQNTITRLEEDNLILLELKNDMDNIINSSYVFHYISFENVNNKIKEGGKTRWDPINSRFVITFYEGNLHTIVHENTHANQNLDGRLTNKVKISDMKCLYDYQDEVEAYLNGDFYKEQFLGIPKRSLEEVENYVEENYYNNDDIIREFKQHRQ